MDTLFEDADRGGERRAPFPGGTAPGGFYIRCTSSRPPIPPGIAGSWARPRSGKAHPRAARGGGQRPASAAALPPPRARSDGGAAVARRRRRDGGAEAKDRDAAKEAAAKGAQWVPSACRPVAAPPKRVSHFRRRPAAAFAAALAVAEGRKPSPFAGSQAGCRSPGCPPSSSPPPCLRALEAPPSASAPPRSTSPRLYWRPKALHAGPVREAEDYGGDLDYKFNEDVTSMHRTVSAAAQQRLKAFDRRFLRRQGVKVEDETMQVVQSERPPIVTANGNGMSFLCDFGPALHVPYATEGDLVDTSTSLSRKASFANREPLWSSSSEGDSDENDQDDDFLDLNEEELSTKDVVLRSMAIVGCSSERQPYIATDLHHAGAVWEANSKSIGEEYVVTELEDGPGCVAAVSFALPGDDSGPHKCAVEYSTMSPVGPWVHAWDFEVPSKVALEFKASHDYAAHRDAKEFVKVCASASSSGSLDDVWRDFFNGEMAVDLPAFVAGCKRLRDHLNRMLGDGTWQRVMEMPRLIFSVLTMYGSEQVTLKDLKTKRDRWPQAQWWKLIVRSNFGSSKRVQVVGPLQLFVIPWEKDRIMPSSRRRNSVGFAGNPAAYAFATAFHMDQLELSGETIVSRRLSKKLTMPITDVEAMHQLFTELGKESPGTLTEQEFYDVIRRIAGVREGEIRDAQLKFFWQVADADGSGNVDFEELLVWIRKYGGDIPCGGSVRRCRLSWMS